jgi:DNA-directed RNA polymerase subunit RPC12/RpoP
MDRDNTIARLEDIAKHAVHTAGEDTFILSLDDGLAIHEAIEALKTQHYQEGTTSDLISRTAAIDRFNVIRPVDPKKDEYTKGIDVGIAMCIVAVKDQPTAQPEQHEGTWVYGEDSTADCVDGYRCSQCGFFVPWDYNHKLIDYINDYAYCPNCGADMRGEKDG